MRIKKAIITAAGIEPNLLPATKSQSKEMFPIIDKPTLHYIIQEIVDSGIEEILIVTGYNNHEIEEYFEHSAELSEELRKREELELLEITNNTNLGANIYYTRQQKPHGIGDAIRCAKAFIQNEPFAVILGDKVFDSEKPCLKQLIDTFNEYYTNIIGVQKVSPKTISKHKIVEVVEFEKDTYKVKNIIEKPSTDTTSSNVAISGRYIFTPEIFEILEKQEQETSFATILNNLRSQKVMYACNLKGKRYDIGDKLGFIEANIDYALKRDDLRAELLKILKSKVKKSITPHLRA